MPIRVTSTTPAFVPSTSTTGTTPALTLTGGTLKLGSSGADVLALQRALAREGFDPGTADGNFGAQTDRAVRAFQRANGLDVDGAVGPHTRALLSGGTVTAQPTPVLAPTQPTAPVATTGEVTAARTRTNTIGGVSTYKVQGKSGVAFKGGMTVDADGSPRAYNAQNTGLDALGNAGKPGNWWGLATDSHGKPVVQGPNDPAPGNYVSTTALEDARFASSDPRRYVDSEKVPFIAMPPQLKDEGVKLGDLVAVRNERTGKTVFAIVADVGPKDHLGEGSIKLAQELGINADARRGGATGGVSYVAFPGSKKTGVNTFETIQAEGARLYAAYGGDAQLASATR
jgi:peptidoglycan hydrolase-like protein with peptidoglycan-binding domain